MNETNTMPSLFDLIGRRWTLNGNVDGLAINHDISCCAVALSDQGAGGGLYLIDMADEEPPHSRIRISGDDGRSTISPRTKALSEPLHVKASKTLALKITPYGSGSFLCGDQNGRLHLVDPDGAFETVSEGQGGAILGLASHHEKQLAAAISERGVTLIKDGDVSQTELVADGETLSAVALSPCGQHVAIGTSDGVRLYETKNFNAPFKTISDAKLVKGLSFRHDGKWLLAGLADAGCQLIDIEGGQQQSFSQYPGLVHSIGWSESSDAFVTSGAFRITAWSMKTPPIHDPAEGALETGQPSMEIVSRVVANPRNTFVAAGYGNGHLVLTKLGLRDELIVQAGETPVTALAWSDDGRQLACGRGDGEVAIIDFPPQMFK